MHDHALAIRLRAARRRKGLTRTQASSASGIPVRTIQRAETKGTDSRQLIHALAQAYGLNPILLEYSREEILQLADELIKAGLGIAQ